MRFRSILLILLALIGSNASAETRLDLDADQGVLNIRVDADAPEVITLTGTDLLPIEWTRNGQRQAMLPAIATHAANDLTIVDDAQKAYAIVSTGALPQVVIDPQRYARDANWHGQPSSARRIQIAFASVLFSLGLLLVLLLRRKLMWVAAAYCAAWLAGVAVVQSRATNLIIESVHPELPLRRIYAREADTLRIPISAPSALLVPIVESTTHLQALSLRVVVRGDDAELVAEISKGEKLYLVSRRYAEGLQSQEQPPLAK